MQNIYKFCTHALSWNVIRQFVLYLIIGGIATVLDISLVFIFTELLGIHYLISVVLSYPLPIFLNFYLNKKFNFRDKNERIYRQLSFFIGINFIGLGLTLGIVYLLVEYILVYYLLAKFIATVMVVFYNFVMHKTITFGGRI